jgi:hypothetical protein
MIDAPQQPSTDFELRWPAGLHPLDQAHLYVPHPLYEWQRDFVNAYAVSHSRAIESTNNESGKTSTLAVICLFSTMIAFPGAMCYATSGSERQVKEQLFEQHLCGWVEKRVKLGWQIKKGEMKIIAPNGSTLLCYVCRNAENVEGFHGYWDVDSRGNKRYRPCAYWIDEAKSVPDGVEQAVRRIDPDFLGVMSTPGGMRGFFHDGIDQDGLEKAILSRKAKR